MNDIPALVDFCQDIATVLADPNVTDKLRNLRFSALMTAHSRAVSFAKSGFDLLLTEPIYKKRAELILKATSATEINKILLPAKPHYDGNKIVNRSPYPIDEEELLMWSEVSALAPLRQEAVDRIAELIEGIYHISLYDL